MAFVGCESSRERISGVSEEIRRVGVVGCGQMGAGIAEVLPASRGGCTVMMVTSASDLVGRGIAPH